MYMYALIIEIIIAISTVFLNDRLPHIMND